MRYAALSVCVVLVLATGASAADPTGTWKYTVNTPDGQNFEVTATLKLEKDKLTGTVKRGDMETKIEEGKFKDNEVSFQVTRERDGNKFIVKYKGKLEGDKITGKISVNAMGQDFELDWKAERQKK
jgi:hypothetical protein